MDRDELVRQYNTAAQSVDACARTMQSAEGDALDTAEKAFREAVAEAQRCKDNLDRADEVASVGKRFTPIAIDNPNQLDMDDKQVRAYSILRAIGAQIAGNWKGAELEREASLAVAQRMGKDPDGFFVPLDVQKRDMLVGTGTAGGYLVGTELQPQNFIDMLRNVMMLKGAGAVMLSGLVGDLAIPRQTAGATGYWVAEAGSPPESTPTVDQVALTPHTYGAYTDLSRKLIKQSSIDAENFVMRDLASTCALGIDLAGLHGTGADNQPTGIAATTGIGSVAGGANGLAPAWSHMIDLETEVAVDNAAIGALSYMTNAKVRGKLKKTLITATYGEEFVWDRRSGDTPINGYKCHVTNQVSSALTKGTSAGVCSAIFYGNWADMIIGHWGTLDILVDPFTGSTSGTVRIVALQDVDVAVRHAQSFSAMLDALTA